MEILSHPVNAPRLLPRVISDSSMTMQFALPASFRQANAALLTTSIRKENPCVKNDVEDSWETHDWETAAIPSVKNVKNVEIEQDKDDWKHESTPELPDDFPRLVINLTRVQRQHFPDTDEVDPMEVFHRVKKTLHAHFAHVAEVFFDQKLGFHCTYGTSRAMLDGLHAAYPDDVLALIDYPPVLDGVPLHEYLHLLSCRSKWKSVEYLKNWLRRCSRDLRWKKDVIIELELLAEREAKRYKKYQQRLSDEIDELTRLRASFREKLEQLARQTSKSTGRYLMLRKLEDIETRLMMLLETYLTEPELEEEECYSAFGGEKGVTTNMNVLDMVIAMVFARLPRDVREQATTDDHFHMLFDHHVHILRLWKKDFGRLPLKSRMRSPHASDSDEDRVDGSPRKAQAPSDILDKADMVQDGQNDEASRGRDNKAARTNVDEASRHVQDDIACDCDDASAQEIRYDSNFDGYGADFDSNGDESDKDAADQVQTHLLSQLNAHCLSFKPRRRRRTHKSTRRSKHQESSEARDASANAGDLSPFQPFACTKAVKALRRAKAHETL